MITIILQDIKVSTFLQSTKYEREKMVRMPSRMVSHLLEGKAALAHSVGLWRRAYKEQPETFSYLSV